MEHGDTVAIDAQVRRNALAKAVFLRFVNEDEASAFFEEILGYDTINNSPR